MLRNYIKITLRNIFKHKGYSFINIFGLALGMACCIFILMWVQDELNFDRYNEKVHNIYRVEEDQYYSGEIYHVTVTPYPCAPVFKERIPEVVNTARINWIGVLLNYGDKSFYETDVVGVDSTYLEMFTFEFLKGDNEKALSQPYSIIINNEIAEKYFGDENPIGKTVTINNQYDFTVTGVFKKLPHNVSYTFEIGFPFEFLKEIGSWSESWGNNSITTFVELAPNSDRKAVDNKLTGLLREYQPDSETDYMVAPLTEMHLYSYFGYGHPVGDIQYVYIFSVIAVFILLIACINFMNLATARSSKRAREIGMRKVVGAVRTNLMKQFFGESLLLAFIGLVLAVLIVILLLDDFNELTRKEIGLEIFSNWIFLTGLIGITLITGIISGTYPALFLSSFQPVKVLKGALTSGVKSTAFRRVLVVIQFTLSVFLIIGTFVVFKQLMFMKEKDLGYNKENLMYISLRGSLRDNYQSIKASLLRTPGVLGVSASNHQPSLIGSNSGGADWDGKDPDKTVLIGQNIVDYNFCKTMGITILEGRDFSEEFTADMVSKNDTIGGFLVNEEVVKIMGLDYKSAVGARFDFFGCTGKIVGVMKNFHYNTVKQKIEPLAMGLAPEFIRFVEVRIAAGNLMETIGKIEKAWGSAVGNYPFEYHFLDEDFERMYRRETRMVGLLEYFSIMAVVIACLGLFGLALFSAEQRTKEIGIRKVLGASISKVIFILCKEFVILIMVANIIAWPIAYLVMKGWLEEFAYRLDLSFLFFILAGILSLVIALLTVSYQAIKVAVANPVNSLRYE
ncbi:MAG: hypothetical protein A2V66_02380 [Ignavibacteria bacterium RBG_13_36_8]|nr:MAG: hypothetical protein A2V66_02380 [Ignavibacteria bacterium RBG_13_36_8]